MDRIVSHCGMCGAETAVEISDGYDPELKRMFVEMIREGVQCDKCSQEFLEQRQKQEAAINYRSALEKTGIPAEAAEWDLEKAGPGQQEFSRRVYQAGVLNSKSMLIHGRSRAGKTRAVCRSAATLLTQGWSAADIRYFTARDLRRTVTRLAQGDSAGDEAAFYTRLVKTRLLIIDDLDKGNWSAASLEGLFRILDDRVLRPRTRIWMTTNVDAADMVAKMTGNDDGKRMTAVAIVARIGEMCQEIRA